MRGIRVRARLLGLQRAVIEAVWIGIEEEVVVAPRARGPAPRDLDGGRQLRARIFAVTGGTGSYTDAHGTVTAKEAKGDRTSITVAL